MLHNNAVRPHGSRCTMLFLCTEHFLGTDPTYPASSRLRGNSSAQRKQTLKVEKVRPSLRQTKNLAYSKAAFTLSQALDIIANWASSTKHTPSTVSKLIMSGVDYINSETGRTKGVNGGWSKSHAGIMLKKESVRSGDNAKGNI